MFVQTQTGYVRALPGSEERGECLPAAICQQFNAPRSGTTTSELLSSLPSGRFRMLQLLVALYRSTRKIAF